MKLLNIQKEIPDILLDIRYCTTYNFIGEIIDGYIDPVALGTKELVKQLKVINSKARQMGYRLKIWDAYRPQSALDHFMTWKDTEDDKMKSIFYPKYSSTIFIFLVSSCRVYNIIIFTNVLRNFSFFQINFIFFRIRVCRQPVI